MLPKDMLIDRSVRKEVCPTLGVPILKRILCNFTPDEFCPDPVPGSVLEALNSRWNVSGGAARPNPQGSFRYGDITVTDVYVIVNRPTEAINGHTRTTLNGLSFVSSNTPPKLAQQFNIPGVYKIDFPNRYMNRPPKLDTSIINGTYRGFTEIIFQNNDSNVQTYHLDGMHSLLWGWILVSGLKVVEELTINGMELLAVQHSSVPDGLQPLWVLRRLTGISFSLCSCTTIVCDAWARNYWAVAHGVPHCSELYHLPYYVRQGGIIQTSLGKLDLKEPYYRMSQPQAYSVELSDITWIHCQSTQTKKSGRFLVLRSSRREKWVWTH